ncbi:MAG TPA: MBL fold metallo-hydrolase [Bacteroidales bacterium]|nr:MBL fold metallo-hydrolase [Bacteroidales bacterium]HRZ76303.1 MBL fold metallo-hydrolase [Bacteroidales bacterium]
MRLFQLSFNPFQVNTYILACADGDAWVIDPGMHTDMEKKAFDDLIRGNGLQPRAIINTHAHIDHILGNQHVRETYGAQHWAHTGCIPFLDRSPEHAAIFGLEMEQPEHPDLLLDDGEVLHMEGRAVHVLYTPGHAEGSICLHIPSMHMLFAGDVLFNGSIGRTDLLTGDYELLLHSIRSKLLVLDPDTRVFSGHGPETTIGFELQSNPYLR